MNNNSNWLALILCLALFAFVEFGCASREYKYAKNPYNLLSIKETLIDTASVYISYQLGPFISGHDTMWTWRRFFSNGRCYIGIVYHYPDEYDVNDLSDSSSQHYYRIDSNEVTMEVYHNPMAGFRYWTGKVYPDSLVIYKIHAPGLFGGSVETVYENCTRVRYRLTNYSASW